MLGNQVEDTTIFYSPQSAKSYFLAKVKYLYCPMRSGDYAIY